MAEQEVTQAETTEEQGESQETQGQTVTAEQFAEIQRQLEETRKAQSGSDRRVKELMEQLKQKEQEAENAEKSAEEKLSERIAEMEKKLQQAEQEKALATQRALAQQLLSDEGLKAPSFLNRLIGGDDEETEAAVKEYIETVKESKLSAADEFARKHGRKVTETEKSKGGGTLEDYTDEQIRAMSDKEFAEVMERSKKQQG